jgi:hypothetical protein
LKKGGLGGFSCLLAQGLRLAACGSCLFSKTMGLYTTIVPKLKQKGGALRIFPGKRPIFP